MNPDGWIVLAILAAAIVAFASNRLRVDAVGFGVLLALAVSGILTAGEAVAGFSDSSVLMIGGLFIIGEALVTTGVAAALGAWLARVGHGSETRLIVLLMLVVASIGAFMSSTGIVAIFIPVVLGLVAKTGASRSRLMMPLSVAALISGLLTLIATPPNLVVSAALTDRGLDALGFFELTPIGMAVLTVAIIYMVTAGRRLLDRPEPKADRAGVSVAEFLASYGLIDQFRALRIEPGSSLIGRTVGEAKVRTSYGVTLVAIARHRGTTPGVVAALADTVMRSGDLLAVAAPADLLDRFAEAEHLREEPVDDRLRTAAGQEVGVAEVMLAPDASLIGKTLRKAQFRSRRGLTVLAIKHRGQVVDGNLIDTPIKFGDLMLVAGGWPLIARLQEDPGEFVVLRLPQELKSIAPAPARAPIALGILAAMIAIMTAGLLPNVIAVLLAALAVVGTGCVAAKGVYRSVGWSTLVLIAGMLPLATALDKTGVTAAMATGLTHLLADLGPYAMLGALFLITAAAGLFISNTATAVLIAPVAIGAAQDLGVSTHAFAVTVAVACSCAFVTPVSSPVNTLVLEPGRYGFSDFVKVGLPLLMLTLIVTVAMVGVLYQISPPQG
ncbi:MAG: SLC13 family permease [Hyphomicrobium sp.]